MVVALVTVSKAPLSYSPCVSFSLDVVTSPALYTPSLAQYSCHVSPAYTYEYSSSAACVSDTRAGSAVTARTVAAATAAILVKMFFLINPPYNFFYYKSALLLSRFISIVKCLLYGIA